MAVHPRIASSQLFLLQGVIVILLKVQWAVFLRLCRTGGELEPVFFGTIFLPTSPSRHDRTAVAAFVRQRNEGQTIIYHFHFAHFATLF